MADLPSTVALPQPLVEPQIHQRSFELRTTTTARAKHDLAMHVHLSQSEWVYARALKRRYRLSLTDLMRSLLLGLPLPAPLPRRMCPQRCDAATARMLMHLRNSLVQAISIVVQGDAGGGSADLTATKARASLEQYLAELLPLMDALVRMLLGGVVHE